MRAVECRWKKIPHSVRRPRCLIRREDGNILGAGTMLLE